MHGVTMWQTFRFIFVKKKKQKQNKNRHTNKQKQKTSKFRVKVDEEKDDAMCRPQLHVMLTLLINLLGGCKYKNYNMTYTYVGLCIIKTKKFQFFAIWVENEGFDQLLTSLKPNYTFINWFCSKFCFINNRFIYKVRAFFSVLNYK